MKGIAFISGFVTGLVTLGIVLPAPAQVRSDGTTNTTVNSIGNNFTILNGIQRGSNLFHSFEEFSIPTGGEATFNNPSAIENIINRVTGGNISNIDGLIKANGSANLFLINPAGIVFGENARLDIGGSFLGSTAQSIVFEDGFNYSAIDSQQPPLLTVSVPLGLQMGINPGGIAVEGSGHSLNRSPAFLITGTADNIGLNAKPGQTLALIGGDININGGILSAADGHLELGSVQDSKVSMEASSLGWQFSYGATQNFKDIRLLQQALVDASGNGGGSINIEANNIDFQDGSSLIIRNFGFLPSGNITINAAGTLNINGIAPDGSLASGIFGQVLGTGAGGAIKVRANEALLSDGGAILNETFNSALGGNIVIDVANTLTFSGISPINPAFPSAVTATTFASGDAGNLLISTRNLVSQNGGIISTSTFGKGNGGSLNINATDSINLFLDTNNLSYASTIGGETFSSGNAGSLLINTERLSIKGGGRVLTSTRSSGKAGDIIINASDSIEVSNVNQGFTSRFQSRISSNAQALAPQLQIVFGTPPVTSGDSGTIEINTPILKVEDNSVVTVGNFGTGNAGNLNIQAESIYLDNQGQIIAATESGEGGNISLQTQDLLLLRNNSSINTEAKGTGNGGNITINSPIIAGFENSDIIANAVEGNGGNINITTQGIFGLEYGDRLTEESEITASSQFGVNGTVEINNVGIDPSSALVELPKELVDSSQQISQRCSSNIGSTFVAAGRGGIPHNPSQPLRLNNTWSDLRDFSASRNQSNHTAEITQISNQPEIVEATGFIRNENGEIELVALENTPLVNKLVSECSG